MHQQHPKPQHITTSATWKKRHHKPRKQNEQKKMSTPTYSKNNLFNLKS
jgi:hypothetical protein